MKLRLPRLAPLLLLCACAAAPPGEDEPIVVEPSAEVLALEVGRAVPLELVPAFETVVGALEDGDERVARAALARVFHAEPRGRALELAQAFERILDGRALREAVHLTLETEELADAGRYRVWLVASQDGDAPLRLVTCGARLHELVVIVDPDGRERRAARTEAVAWPAPLDLPPGRAVRHALCDLRLDAPSGLLALSARLDLEVLAGEFRPADGRSLPAQDLVVEPHELVRLASQLDTTPVPPEEVAAYVAQGRIYVPALMERAVRVLPADRGAALDALEPLIEKLPLVELELCVPALRWLSGTTAPGGDPEAWRVWLRARSEHLVAEPQRPRLMLPVR